MKKTYEFIHVRRVATNVTQGLEGMLESRIPHVYQNTKVVALNLADCSHSTTRKCLIPKT